MLGSLFLTDKLVSSEYYPGPGTPFSLAEFLLPDITTALIDKLLLRE